MRPVIWGIHPTCIAGSALLCGIFRASPDSRRARLLDAEPKDATVQAVMLAVNGDGLNCALLPSDGDLPLVGRRSHRDQPAAIVAVVFVHGGENHEPRRRSYGVFTPWKCLPHSIRSDSKQRAPKHELTLLTGQNCMPSGDAALCQGDDELTPSGAAARHNTSFTVLSISATVYGLSSVAGGRSQGCMANS
jgi:hypothetical protein